MLKSLFLAASLFAAASVGAAEPVVAVDEVVLSDNPMFDPDMDTEEACLLKPETYGCKEMEDKASKPTT